MSDARRDPERLRIAVLNRVFAARGGGAENYSVQVVQALAARHEVHVFAQEIRHEWPGVHYHRIRTGLRKPRWVNQIVYAVATWRATRQGFDVVHSHENTWHGDIQSLHVKSVRQGIFGESTGWRRALRWLKVALSPRLLTYLWLEGARFAPRPGRQLVLASEAMREPMARVYPAAADRLHVITPGVTLDAAGPDRAACRARLGLPASAPLLLFVANDYARKGLETLLDALAQLPPEVQLAVAGKADQQARFRAQAQRLGLSARVHFLGPQDDLVPSYRAADLLVHPTREDSFAMVVLEAMAEGLPVVASAAPWCGISALLQDGQDARLLPDPHDAPALATAIASLLEDSSSRARLREGGLAFARAHDWAGAARAFEALYRQSVRERAAR